MSQQAKKSSGTYPARDAEITLKAVETTKQVSENMIAASSRAANEMMENASNEARRTQEMVMGFSREGAEQISKGTAFMGQVMNEMVNLNRDQMAAFAEFSNIAAQIMQEAGSDAMNMATAAFSENVENAKGFFQLKTYNDFIDYSNRMYRGNMDSFFKSSMMMSNYYFQFASEAFEPFGEKANDFAEKFARAFRA